MHKAFNIKRAIFNQCDCSWPPEYTRKSLVTNISKFSSNIYNSC